ncbi:MAG: hypothetical protein JJP05_01660 [cyanobacterium endosymbiont of Rhopalodia gibba]|jgi:NAD(P)H-quinone oxidoreductase subunit 4
MLLDAHAYLAPILVILAVINIVYSCPTFSAKSNMKRRLAYSSVSHMSFVSLGIVFFINIGSRVMLQSISHRLVAAALFFLESVIYDRTYTMILEEMKNISLVMLKVFTLFAIDAITYPA